MPPFAKSRVSPQRSSMDPTQGQSQNQESCFSHGGKGRGKSFLTRTNDPKSTHRYREKELCTWPSNQSYHVLAGQREHFQASKQETLNIMTSEKHSYLLSPPTPLQAGKCCQGQLQVLGGTEQQPEGTCRFQRSLQKCIPRASDK